MHQGQAAAVFFLQPGVGHAKATQNPRHLAQNIGSAERPVTAENQRQIRLLRSPCKAIGPQSHGPQHLRRAVLACGCNILKLRFKIPAARAFDYPVAQLACGRFHNSASMPFCKYLHVKNTKGRPMVRTAF